ncbi:hypothetical protein BJX66DRAFT_341680 [Aspergillus keveii]|uniref:LysM domain-containing protein n=1 Tax=Aspergillus keveii TaxID=714993 RepID=A0ABR4FUQ8_9EURO
MAMGQYVFMVLFRSVLRFLVLGASTACAQLYLFNPEHPFQLSPECNSALTAEVDCGLLETGGTMYTRDADLTADILDQMCTVQCKASLKTYREAVDSACKDEEYDTAKNATVQGSSGVYMPIVLPDYYITNYNQRCLKDINGEYCVLKLQEADSVDKCDECTLLTLREKLNNGYFSTDYLLEEFSNRTSSCGVSTIPPPTPSSVLISSAPVPTATERPCDDGRKVAIQPGDTCDTFALAHNVSTYRLLIDNGLQSGCENFPSEGSLCVIGSCQTHNVSETDTCPGLASKYGITITQFITWNQVLNSRCTNIGTLVGHMACVSYPGNATSTKNPYATNPVEGTATTAVPAPTNVAPDVNTACGKYYRVKEGDYCQVIAMSNGIMLDDLYFLNPGIDKNCTNLWLDYNYCVRPVGNIETYPGYATVTGGPTTSRWMPTLPSTVIDWSDLPSGTLPPWTSLPTPSTAPLANGTRKDCKEYKDNTRGELPCEWFMGFVSILNFADWNPSLDWWNCTLANNTRYCTLLGDSFIVDEDDLEPDYEDMPVNAAPNSTYDCYYWYPTGEGDTCDSILQLAGIALDAFYAWNPSVKSDCSNLWLETSYCIWGDGYDDTYYPYPEPTSTATPTTTTATTPPTSSDGCPTSTPAPPGPTQTGIPCTCTRYVLQEDSIYCADMATKYGISLETLYELNPALKGDCSGLWPGYAYCVETGLE